MSHSPVATPSATAVEPSRDPDSGMELLHEKKKWMLILGQIK